MEIEQTGFEGLLILEPKVFKDERGYFFESFNLQEFREKVGDINFVQDNESMSSYGVVRGLHFQSPPHAQAKLVRCVKGAVIDINVDIRRDSPTFGKSITVELNEDNKRQLFIPRGFAHGFAVISPTAIFQYKCDNYYYPESEGGISVFDKDLQIDWPFDLSKTTISDKDKKFPTLKNFESPFQFSDITI